jgi:hypothetical protein
MPTEGTTACGRTPARPAVQKIQCGCRVQAYAIGVLGKSKAKSLSLEGSTLSGTTLHHEKRTWKVQWDACGNWPGAPLAVASKRLIAFAPANDKTAWVPLVERELSLGARVTASAVSLLGRDEAKRHFPSTFEDQMLVGTTRSHHKKSWEVDWDAVGTLWPGARLPLQSMRMKPLPVSSAADRNKPPAPATAVATASKKPLRRNNGRVRKVGHDESDDDVFGDSDDDSSGGGDGAGGGGGGAAAATTAASGAGAAPTPRASKAVPAKRKAGADQVATQVRAVPAADVPSTAVAVVPITGTASGAAAAAVAVTATPATATATVAAAASASATAASSASGSGGAGASAVTKAKKQKKRPNRMPLGDRVYILTTVNTDAHEPVSEVYGVYNSFDIALSNASSALGWRSTGARFWEWPEAEFKKHCEEVTNKYDALRHRGGLDAGQMQTVCVACMRCVRALIMTD